MTSFDATQISEVEDVTEAIEFCSKHNLYFIPICKIGLTVILPQFTEPGNSISNWEIMEKIRSIIQPDIFVTLKVLKSTLEYVRLEGDVKNKSLVKILTCRLDGVTIKISGLRDPLTIRAAEAKLDFPVKNDWDTFFRDAQNMNEMKAGERPDTIHIRDFPSSWFSDKALSDGKPSEEVLKECFEIYGNIRLIDIPILDKYRKDMQTVSARRTANFNENDLVFEAFIQYKEYVGFVKAMNAMRGMKLLHKTENGANLTAFITVNFDQTKHLSDKNVRKRRAEANRLQTLEEDRIRKRQKEIEDEIERKKESSRKREWEQIQKDKRKAERAEKRRRHRMEREAMQEEERMQAKIAKEERKIVIANRKLQSVRLLTELLDRVKRRKQQEELERREKELEEERLRQIELVKLREEESRRKKIEAEQRKKESLERKEEELRRRITTNVRVMAHKKIELEKKEKRDKLSKDHVRLMSAIIPRKRPKYLL